MDKKAHTRFSIHPILETRWSPRAFSDEAIDFQKIQRMLEAARWAPSCFNEQPWRFIIGVKNEGETYRNILSSLAEFNQKWAVTAPLLILCCGKKHFTLRDEENIYFKYDTGQAAAYLTMQAVHEGLYVHQMAGFDKHKVIELFNLPIDYEPLTVMAFGYMGDPEMLPEEIKKMEYADRYRNELNSFVFEERFGEKWHLI
jgi:nitroreductase